MPFPIHAEFLSSVTTNGRVYDLSSIYTVYKSKGRELNSAPTLASQPATGHNLKLYYYYCYYDLGLRPVCGAGHRKLRPNLAPMPKLV